jgi:hypothetical protein
LKSFNFVAVSSPSLGKLGHRESGKTVLCPLVGLKKRGGLQWWFLGWGFRLPLPVGEVGQVVLTLLPTRLQGLMGSLTLFPFKLCLPSTSVVILEFWIGNFGIFGIVFVRGGKWKTVFRMAGMEVPLLLLKEKLSATQHCVIWWSFKHA